MSPAAQAGHRALLLAERRGDRADPLVLVVVGVPAGRPAVPGDVHDGVRPQRAGEDPDQADPADVGVGGGLDDLGQQRARRVGRQAADGLAVRGGDRRQRVLGRRRERLGDDLEQFLHADVVRRGRGEDRVEAAARDGLLQVLDEALDLDLLTGEVGVHEGLVFALLDDRLDQRAACFLDAVGLLTGNVGVGPAATGVVVEALRQQADEAADPALAVGDRQVQRRHRVAERGPAGGQRLVEVAALVVDLGDHDGPRRADGCALVPEHLGQAVDAVGGRDGEQRGVGRAQPGPQVAGEVGVARRVQQVHLDVAVHERHQRQVDRAAAA